MVEAGDEHSRAGLTDERERVLQLVRRHGWNATAFQTLELGYRYFFHTVGDDEGCVAYVDTGGAWVAAGAPIATESAVGALALAFVRAARGSGKRCCFFAVEQRLLDVTSGALDALEVGEQPSWDPRAWPEALARRHSLREQLRRARAKGVAVRELASEELAEGPQRAALERVIRRWLATRGLAPMAFLVRIEPFAFAAERRWFVAEHAGRAVAFAGLVPVPARAGWFVEDVLREPDAPNGTSELLLDAAMRWSAAHGATWLTLGLVPLAGSVPLPLAFFRRYATALYDFRGLHRYKQKLAPSAWTTIYVAYPPAQSGALAIVDSLAAFAGGGLVRFGLRSLVRGPPFMVRALAYLLVPWTLVLALPAARRYCFDSAVLQWAWVSFDVLLALGLFRLLVRPSVDWATLLAVAVTLDTLLTTLQGALWLARQSASEGDVLLIVIACAAPALRRCCCGARARGSCSRARVDRYGISAGDAAIGCRMSACGVTERAKIFQSQFKLFAPPKHSSN
jgi:phosphatidylglycerol lysyltransferase